MSDRFELIPFEERQIMTVRNKDGIHVVMKPVVEALGLDWRGQLNRINRHPVISKGVVITATPSAGGMQEMVTLALEQFHGWLMTLSPDRITDEDKRAVIIQYQERAFRVIFEHFHGRMAWRRGEVPENPAADERRHRHAIVLMDRLERATNPDTRRFLYAMLEATAQGMGLEAPPVAGLGREIQPPPDMVNRFWRQIDSLLGAGDQINHSRDPAILAVHMPTLRESYGLDISTSLGRALKADPHFLAVKAVNSRLMGKAVKCWVFAMPAG